MSDLNPKGISIVLGGQERHFLFTLNVIDEIQTQFDKTPYEALNMLTDEKEQIRAMKQLATILVNDEVDREKFKNGETNLKKITEKEAGWLIDLDNLEEVSRAILLAYGASIPEADDEEEDPNFPIEQPKS